MVKIDDELRQACQRYLDERKRRENLLGLDPESLRKAELEEKKREMRREYWRRKLYGGNSGAITYIVTGNTSNKKK